MNNWDLVNKYFSSESCDTNSEFVLYICKLCNNKIKVRFAGAYNIGEITFEEKAITKLKDHLIKNHLVKNDN